MQKLKPLISEKTQLINLNGKTLMPGFYDAHSHFSLSSVSLAQGFDLSSPPLG
jgi:hypothetical protein